MKYSYYPGCTLKTKAKELDKYARASAEALGIELCELDAWQCCGGAYTMVKGETALKLSSVRALAASKARGTDLVTLCSACHNVLKQVNNDMQNDEATIKKVHSYMKDEEEYNGETKVIHFLELLRDVVGFDKLKEKVVNPLGGKKIAAYYGCLLLRPSKIMAMDNPENPKIIEDFITAIGGTPVIYPYRNECCGGYIALEDKKNAIEKSSLVMMSAENNGAEEIITACPLCLYNLNKNAKSNLPVKYFTELLAEALGVKGEK